MEQKGKFGTGARHGSQAKHDELTGFALEPEILHFLKSLQAFQTLVSKYHASVRTHSHASLEKFLSFPKEQQSAIIQGFKGYLDFLSECAESGIDLRNDRRLLQAFIKRLGFIYSDDLLDQIQDGDVVEIYTAEQIQIFRNIVFMDLCNYTLLDLLAYDPYELYERSEKVKQYLQESVISLIGRPYNTSLLDMTHVPPHVLREKFSEQRLSSVVEFRFLAPLYKWPPKEMVAFVAVQSGRNLPEYEAPPIDALSFL